MNTRRKGSIQSLEVILLIVITPLFMASVLVNVLMEKMLDLTIVNKYSFPVEMAHTVQGYSGALDAIVLVAFTALVGRILLRSFQINMHPIFGIVGLLGLPVLVIVAAQVSNVAGVFTNLSLVQSAVNHFPASYAFFQNLPKIAAVIGLIILIVMVGTGKVRR